MRNIDELETTSNRSVYKKLHRKEICTKTGKCSYCPMHARENAGPHRYKRKKKEYQLSKSKRRDRDTW